MQTFSHPFVDIEIEPTSTGHLVKILSIDGRRFTYDLRAPFSPDAITYIKSLIDAAVFGDLIIEETDDGFESRESPVRVAKHS